MLTDPIVEEVRKIRMDGFERLGHDLAAFVREIEASQRSGDHRVVRRTPCRPVASPDARGQEKKSPAGV
jgi:hypothetical protein